MFAYCLNNPVNGCDPCGTCFHRWDFWNDCDKCGGKSIGDKWEDVTSWCADAYETITSVHQQQMQLETQILMQQNEIVADVGGAIVDAYVNSVQMQQETQMWQASATIQLVKDAYNTYEVVQDTAVAKYGKGALKVRKGVKWVKKGAGYILAPVPTVADDLVGMGYVVAGVVYTTVGVTEVIVCMVCQE